MKFRPDINGLRALAVIAVVLFHFNESILPGGFAGVDVFFVISGFLMTGIIFNGLTENNFSITNFYIARANRIVPPLAIVCLILLLTGFFYFPPLDYRALAKHVFSSITFFSNIIYWRESGYFGTAPHSNWLLHTWSLSVEWQFYILYPIALVLLRKVLSLRHLKCLLVVTTILGFFLGAYATSRMPSASYFLLPTRAWEMMIGGLAFLYPFNLKNKNKKYLEFFGLILIISSYFITSDNDLWPGYLTLIPVLGTYFVIISNNNKSIVTNNFAMQKIGRWSYSIYLWHWPVLAGFYYLGMQHLALLGIPVSFALGFLSFKYIESFRLIKSKDLSSGETITSTSLLLTIATLMISIFIYTNTNYIYNIPKEIFSGITVSSNTDGNKEYTFVNHKKLNDKNSFEESKYKVMVIGDSQAGDILNSLYSENLNDDVSIISRLISTRCKTFSLVKADANNLLEKLSLNNFDKMHCLSRFESIGNESLVDEADIIIVAMQWDSKFNEFAFKSFRQLRNKNRNASIYVFGPKNFDESIPSMIYSSYKINSDVSSYAFKRIPNDRFEQNNILSKKLNDIDIRFINLTDIICSGSRCNVEENGNPFFFDSSHLTREGTSFLGKSIHKSKILPEYFFFHQKE